MEKWIDVKGISKTFGTQKAVSDISFTVRPGQVIGLLGHNGAGKSTLIKALLGMLHYEGEIEVMGLSPQQHRAKLMESIAYISDVSALPSWMTVKQCLDYVSGVHPQFSLEKAQQYLADTDIKQTVKISQLSKGMKVQFHLAVVMATDAKVLIFDEPTLGLDLIYREKLYAKLQAWLEESTRALIIASHEVSEIEHLLTDVIVLKQGKMVLKSSMAELETNYSTVLVDNENYSRAESLSPIYIRKEREQTRMIFENLASDQLKAFSQVCRTSLAELFIAKQVGLEK
ncbi:multidrug ABC transporter ATP-binding protein [Photobacterium jeanii]|uniref:Multidrug ABC transporter ATP-binding protein n=1 Tax=Photobacterium jeanii TaxID=858640 RepID=A0A178KK68_9GAMM|nr:ABC transporter ATP-binding protein [Photobacterium jeanii]OAN17758.1 multidrug ABC transporter ATP-binding protein [Photobacterium jeanii]PST92577.1 ABC transporter ATP-binding protein [Photobacterium jeanii]